VAGALDGFDRFLRTYPSSPLAEPAMIERMRLLRTTNQEKAEDAAIEYLTRYPKGSAHAEAEAVVRGTP
jgi:TolA-binding protein